MICILLLCEWLWTQLVVWPSCGLHCIQWAGPGGYGLHLLGLGRFPQPAIFGFGFEFGRAKLIYPGHIFSVSISFAVRFVRRKQYYAQSLFLDNLKVQCILKHKLKRIAYHIYQYFSSIQLINVLTSILLLTFLFGQIKCKKFNFHIRTIN